MAAGTKTAKSSYTVVVGRSILTMKVVNTSGEDLGKIEDLVIDIRDDRISYAILSFGGFLGMGDKHFAIPWQDLSINIFKSVAVLNIDKDRLKNAPGFDKDNWPDMSDSDWARGIHKHYGTEMQS
jgi:sporulation protein YlmC with PRC-barrel domain